MLKTKNYTDQYQYQVVGYQSDMHIAAWIINLN